MSGPLDGRVAIVTGGARGIGLAIAERLLADGACVVLADNGTGIDGHGADPAVATDAASKLGPRAIAFTDSIAEPGAAVALVKSAQTVFGGLDIVVNNAAIMRDAFIFKGEPGDFEAVLRTNLFAAFNLLAAATPVLREQGKAGRGGGEYDWGRIVNITSSAGLYGNFGQAAYASAKAGLFGLTRVVAMDMARNKVTANAIAPFAATRVTDSIKPANDAQADYKARALSIPASHVANLVAHLCSPAARDVTGQLFGVRGRELFLFGQPRPVAQTLTTGANVDLAALRPHFTDLATDLEHFSADPVL